MFPIEPNGWQKRQPARGIDPIDIREVPINLAAEAGIPSEAHLPERPQVNVVDRLAPQCSRLRR